MFSPEVSAEESRFASCFCKSQIYFYWTSQPTTSMPRVCFGLSSTWPSIRVLCLLLLTTVTFWTMWRSGSWNLIAAGLTHTRVITPLIWKRKPSVLRCKARKTPSSKKDFGKNSNGFARVQRRSRLSPRRVWLDMKRWQPRQIRLAS